MFVSITPSAHEFLRDLPEHKYRKKDIAFNGRTFVETPHPINAKGLSQYLHNFLINPTPQFPSLFYDPKPPYYIHPYSFIDTREFAPLDYKNCGLPGDDPNPYSMFAHRDPDSSFIYYEYTNWSNGESTTRHQFSHIDHLSPILSAICYYWHISIFRPPRSHLEAAGAVLNAIGLGYLSHRNLPPHPTQTTEFIPQNLEFNPKAKSLYGVTDE